jgi:hypothetical protein
MDRANGNESPLFRSQAILAALDIQTLRQKHPDHWMRATAIRALTLDAVAAANSGHSGMPMGMADVATVLFRKAPEVRPQGPALGRPRPFHPVGGPRLDADLRCCI